MLTTVGFDNELVPRASEIDDKITDRMLATKLVTGHSTAAQKEPEPPLCVGLRLAKPPGAFVRHKTLTRLAALGTLSRSAGEGRKALSLQSPQKFDHRRVDLGRALLLSPVTAARQHDRPAQLRHELR
jgi:hypothetical protein